MNYDFDGLAKKFSRRFLLSGDILFREGDTNGDGFIVEKGELELTRYHDNVIERTALLEEGEVVGVWKILFNNETRYFTATATKETTVIVIPESHLSLLLNQADPFLIHCFQKWLDVSRSYMADSSSGS